MIGNGEIRLSFYLDDAIVFLKFTTYGLFNYRQVSFLKSCLIKKKSMYKNQLQVNGKCNFFSLQVYVQSRAYIYIYS